MRTLYNTVHGGILWTLNLLGIFLGSFMEVETCRYLTVSCTCSLILPLNGDGHGTFPDLIDGQRERTCAAGSRRNKKETKLRSVPSSELMPVVVCCSSVDVEDR